MRNILVLHGIYYPNTLRLRSDVAKVIKMILIHDLIEIYAGDTFCYDGRDKRQGGTGKTADKLFSQLPKDQAESLKTFG